MDWNDVLVLWIYSSVSIIGDYQKISISLYVYSEGRKYGNPLNWKKYI